MPYLGRIAGTAPVGLVLKPPRDLFAPSRPGLESTVPETAIEPSADAPGQVESAPMRRRSRNNVAPPQVGPRAMPSEPALVAPEQKAVHGRPAMVAPKSTEHGFIDADVPVVHELKPALQRPARVEVAPSRYDRPTAPESDTQVVPASPLTIPTLLAPTLQTRAPGQPPMILRPRYPETPGATTSTERPKLERVETQTIRLQPPAPAPAPPPPVADAGENGTRVRIGSLEVRIVTAPAAAPSQSQSPSVAPAPSVEQARPASPLSRGFRSFGLTQG